MSDKDTGPSLFRRNQKTTCPQGEPGLEPPCGGLPEQVLCWPALGPRPFLSVLLLVAGLVPGIICPVSLLSGSRGLGGGGVRLMQGCRKEKRQCFSSTRRPRGSALPEPVLPCGPYHWGAALSSAGSAPTTCSPHRGTAAPSCSG